MGLRSMGWTTVVVQVVKIEVEAHQLVITRKGAAAGTHTDLPLVERTPLTGMCHRSENGETVRQLMRGGTQNGDESLQVFGGHRSCVYIIDSHSSFPTCSAMNFPFQMEGELCDGKRQT